MSAKHKAPPAPAKPEPVFLLPNAGRNAIAEYLGTRPYNEVAQLIAYLAQLQAQTDSATA